MLTNLYNIENGESKLVLSMYVLTYIWMYVCTTINIEMDFISLGQHLALLLGRTHGWTLGR